MVISAVVVEGRSPAEVARSYGVARSWVYELVARYRAEGEGAFEPRSRRPKRSPRALGEATVDLIVELAQDTLDDQGLAGPGGDDPLAPRRHHGVVVGGGRSAAT